MKKGLKYDKGKDRWDLLPWSEVKDVVKVMTFGAKKYGDNNWQQVERWKSRYFAAFMRHFTDWLEGERYDKESGFHHLAHAATCLIFMLWFDKRDFSFFEKNKETDYGRRFRMLDVTNNPDLVVGKAAPEKEVKDVT